MSDIALKLSPQEVSWLVIRLRKYFIFSDKRASRSGRVNLSRAKSIYDKLLKVTGDAE